MYDFLSVFLCVCVCVCERSYLSLKALSISLIVNKWRRVGHGICRTVWKSGIPSSVDPGCQKFFFSIVVI